jgi:hypothetical protein
MKHKNIILSICLMTFAVLAFITGAAAPIIAGVKLSTIAVGGDFTCANLLEIQGKAETMWMDNAVQKDYMPKVDVLLAIINNQTAKLEPIVSTQSKDYVIKMSWINACEIEGADCGSECEIDGPELSAECKEYAPNLCREFSFKVNENTFRTSIYSPEEIVAKGLLKQLKLADEYLAQQTVLYLESNKGENEFAGIGSLVGSGIGGQDTVVAPSNWNASIMGYFYQVAIMNKISNPMLLSGSNLFQAMWNAQANAANADGKGDLNKFQQMPIFFDLFNIDSTLSPALKTFLLDKSAVAFGSINRFSETPIQILGANTQQRYSVASKTLPGVRYDVYYTTACEGEQGNLYHKFKLVVRGGIYSNPVGCTTTNNGLIAFKNA